MPSKKALLLGLVVALLIVIIVAKSKNELPKANSRAKQVRSDCPGCMERDPDYKPGPCELICEGGMTTYCMQCIQSHMGS